MTDKLYMEWLTDERYTWRYEMQHGFWHEPFVLQQYRVNRNSNLWRSTREVEKLCEYVLFLEGAKPMCERIVITCDQCDTDISSSQYYPMYRLRLTEETRSIKEGAEQSQAQPELPGMMNFCNCECLQAWLNK